MAEGRAKIIIDADAAKVIAEAIRAGNAIEGAGRKARGFGKAIQEFNKDLAGTVVKTTLVLKTLNALGDSLEKLRGGKVEASTKVGGAELRAQVAGSRLGIGSDQASALLQGAGVVGIDDRAAYLEKLASDKDLKGRLDAGTLSQASALYRSGLYQEDEIKAGIKGGTLAQLAAEDRQSKLTGRAAREYNTQLFETQRGMAAANIRANDGFGARYTDANTDYMRARNPGRAVAADTVGQALGFVGADRATKYLERIAYSSDETARWSYRPRIGPTPE
jgi:hypothetical protein